MKTVARLETKYKNLEDALLDFRHALNYALLEEARKKGYGLSHFEVIKYISEEGNPTMKDIAAHLRITPPSASALVEALVARHLVARSESQTDRRSVRVLLAPKGQILISSLHKKKHSTFNQMLSGLSAKDKNDFARILIKCISNNN